MTPAACIETVPHDVWPVFEGWAAAEGWRVPAHELTLYREAWADKAFVLWAGGEPCGFVTVCPHERSGWIGNLIVGADLRGRGYGRRLFEHAMGELERRGVKEFWLTASEDGRPLYAQYGFRDVDGVERWVFAGDCSGQEELPCTGDPEVLAALDATAWGDHRSELLRALCGQGLVFATGETAALLQQVEGRTIIGPWFSANSCPRENRQVLTSLLAAPGSNREMVVDVLASSPVRMLLGAAGFVQQGGTRLMARTERAPRLAGLVALASLGSLG